MLLLCLHSSSYNYITVCQSQLFATILAWRLNKSCLSHKVSSISNLTSFVLQVPDYGIKYGIRGDCFLLTMWECGWRLRIWGGRSVWRRSFYFYLLINFVILFSYRYIYIYFLFVFCPLKWFISYFVWWYLSIYKNCCICVYRQ